MQKLPVIGAAALAALSLSGAAFAAASPSQHYTIAPAVIAQTHGPWVQRIVYTNDSTTALRITPRLYAESADGQLSALPHAPAGLIWAPKTAVVPPDGNLTETIRDSQKTASHLGLLALAFMGQPVSVAVDATGTQSVGAPAATLALGKPTGIPAYQTIVAGPWFYGGSSLKAFHLKISNAGTTEWLIPHVALHQYSWGLGGAATQPIAENSPAAMTHAPSLSTWHLSPGTLPVLGLSELQWSVTTSPETPPHIITRWIISWPVVPSAFALGLFILLEFGGRIFKRKPKDKGEAA